MSPIQTPRVSVHTLGCKLNYSETSTLAASLAGRGAVRVPFGDETDVFLLNTCSVTENAEKECRQIIRRTLRQSPHAYIIVTGCYAQLRPEEIASIEGVDLVLGASEKFDVLKYAGTFDKSNGPRIFASEIADATEFHFGETSVSDDRTRAFLKVQDGCDYSCSFCTIPKARGASRSGEIEEILRRARILCDEGRREIVLSGVNVGDFGKKTGASFYDLALALDNDSEIAARIRISSIEPNLLTDDIVNLVAKSTKFCPHFHIPMQSGSDMMLRAMQRRYSSATYRTLIERIKNAIPHACIGADVIVGFPGETDQSFQETCDFIRSLELSYLHVFTYSERPGTKASAMTNPVPVHIRRERNRLLRIISEKKQRAFYEAQLGREVNLILEKSGDGYSDNYVRARLVEPIPAGAELVHAKLLRVNGEVAEATLLSRTCRSANKRIIAHPVSDRIAHVIDRVGETRIIIAIACIAFVAQLVNLHAPTFFGEPYLVAKHIAAGKGYVFAYPLTGKILPTCYVTPLYVYLQVPFLVSGLGERGIQVMNLIFLQAACFVLYRLFRRFTSRTVALLIFLALSFYVPFWILAYTLDPNTLNILLLALTVDRLYVISKFPATSRWIQLGILIGLQLLLRPDILLGGALFAVWLLVWNRSKLTWRGMGIAGLIALAMVAPWTVRNYLTFHKFVLVSANSGMNLYEGNNPVATGEFRANPPNAASIYEFEETTDYADTHDAIDLDHYRLQLAEQWILHHPGEVFMLDLRKVWYHWFGRPIMGEQFHYQYQTLATAFRIASVLMLLLGLYGLYSIRDNRLRSLLLVIFFYSTLVSAIFFVQSRHRILKVDPFLLPLAVVGLVAVTFKSRARSDTHRDLKVAATKTVTHT